MYTKTVVVTNKAGLHARPASLFCKTAAGFQAKVWLKKGEKQVDAKSILNVMSLGIAQDTTIELSSEGPDEQAAVEALVSLLASNFGE